MYDVECCSPTGHRTHSINKHYVNDWQRSTEHRSISFMKLDSLGDRMKRYEAVTRSVLLPNSYTIVRVDGRAFHTYLADAQRPYDFDFVADMKFVAANMVQDMQGALLAYGQSDEISFVLSDHYPRTDIWFGGVVQKIASVSASLATSLLMVERGCGRWLQFDSRVFTVPSDVEAANYLIWRQQDAVRNSISMAAQAKFSHKVLHGVPKDQMQEMLFKEHGINWNDYPADVKRGWIVSWGEPESRDVTYTDTRTGSTHTKTVVDRELKASNPEFNVTYLCDLLTRLRQTDLTPERGGVE